MDADGHIVLAGTALSSLDGQTHGGLNDILLMSYTSSGDHRWTLLHGSSSAEAAWGLQTFADGSVVVGGYSTSSLDGEAYAGSNDIMVALFQAESCWQGLSATLQLEGVKGGGGSLEVSITAHLTLEKAQKAKEAGTVFFDGVASCVASFGHTSSLTFPARCQETADIDEKVVVRGDVYKMAQSVSRGVLSGETGPGYAYATALSGGREHLAVKMVTHSWRNKFTHLLAGVLADALDAEKYDEIAQSLREHEFGKLTKALQKKGKLDVRYWICAFSVNQHAGICATPPPTDSTGHAITPCSCTTAKHFEGDLSEMNKFDDMMAYLKKSFRQQGKARLEQVVALEADFSLLTRVWCLAELYKAHELHLPQARDLCLDRLARLDVLEAEASFPADKELVLGKIDDAAAFNVALQDLVLHRLDSFLQSNRARSAAALLDEVVLASLSIAI
ncbi:SYT4 [Symbiodinium pilosum]|uniref:SYT4 protein n=1 Tax=Symbiodinium pilosum TaxID=2952 RepID=A0A812PUM6_SYMPI|nr:SYT4 [Symbiodinium pilosum]